MRESGFSVRMEQYGVVLIREEDVEGRRMDLVGADPWGGPRVLADVTVADPLREGLIPETAVERGRAAREAAVTSGWLNHWTKKPTADFRHPPYGAPNYIY
jgi:hypothetical protein